MKKQIILFCSFGLSTLVYGQAIPSWSITGNNNTTSSNFLGTTASQPLIFKTNNVETMRILTSAPSPGNVGIGTTNPLQKLSVAGTIGFNTNLISRAQDLSIYWGNGTAGDLKFKTTSAPESLVSATERMVIKQNGNVGIATLTDPSEKLHVNGTLRVDGTDGNGGIRVFKDGSDAITSHLYLGNVANTKAFNFQLNLAGTSLDLWNYHAGAWWQNKFQFSEGGNFSLGGGHIVYNSADGVIDWGHAGTGDLLFRTLSTQGDINAYTNRMVIKNNGNVGIGTTGPSAYLHIKGYDHGTGLVIENNSTNIANTQINYVQNNLSKAFSVINAVGTAKLVFRIMGDGKTYIGDQIPNLTGAHSDAKLSVDGKVIAKSFYVTEAPGIWADYVFEKDYKLMTLVDVEKYIKENKHLPNVPSTKEVEENGLNLVEINAKLLEKIEEAYLHIIDLNKRIDQFEKKIKDK